MSGTFAPAEHGHVRGRGAARLRISERRQLRLHQEAGAAIAAPASAGRSPTRVHGGPRRGGVVHVHLAQPRQLLREALVVLFLRRGGSGGSPAGQPGLRADRLTTLRGPSPMQSSSTNTSQSIQQRRQAGADRFHRIGVHALALGASSVGVEYVNSEWKEKADDRFDEFLSPIFFWILVAVLPLTYTLLTEKELQQGGILAVFLESKVLLAAAIASLPLLVYVTWIELTNNRPIRKSALQRMFYVQCYITPLPY